MVKVQQAYTIWATGKKRPLTGKWFPDRDPGRI